MSRYTLRDRIFLTIGNAARRRLRRWDKRLADRLEPADRRRFAARYGARRA